jgi:hypothetical protein
MSKIQITLSEEEAFELFAVCDHYELKNMLSSIVRGPTWGLPSRGKKYYENNTENQAENKEKTIKIMRIEEC